MIDPGQRVQVIFVETPAAGSPKVVRDTKPGPYPRNAREHWQPRTRPPTRSEKFARFLDSMNRNEQAARDMMKPDLALLKARYGG
jgi:hypothetical protein